MRAASPPNPGVDDGGPDQLEDRASGGMGTFCSQSSAIGATYRAALEPLACQAPPQARVALWPLDRAGVGELDGQAGVCGVGYLHAVAYLWPHSLLRDVLRSCGAVGVAGE